MSTREKIAALYIATFNRAADADGISYWVDSIDIRGLTIEEVAQSFFDSPEAKEMYPSSVQTDQFVESVYRNILNRDVDSDGLNYWVSQLDSGSITRGNFILAIDNAVAVQSGTDDYLLRQNKINVSEYYVDKGLSDTSIASTVLENITKDSSSVEDAKLLIDNTASGNSVSTEPTYAKLSSDVYFSEYTRNNADELVFEHDSDSANIISYAIEAHDDNFAILHDDFYFHATEGHSYTVMSASFFDPIGLYIGDKDGYPISMNNEALEYLAGDMTVDMGGIAHQVDMILDWEAPYTGIYYVSAGWDQGNYFKDHSIYIADHGIA